jgi:hypothetical protein
MIKKLMVILALVTMLASVANAQWTSMGAFPDTTYNGGTHGLAVDPDGKVWVASYYKDVLFGADSVATSGILVFNADGTEADFSPVSTVATGGGFVVDTLNGNCRGMGVDKEGNILYVQTGTSKMFKINYQTGEGMARADLSAYVSHPTAPSVSDDGTIYVGNVLPGAAIATFDVDLGYLGNAVDVVKGGYSRTNEVSADGLTLYNISYSEHITYVYTRADDLSAFELTDSTHIGMSIESSAWNPATGNLWVSDDHRSVADTNLTMGAWYEYNSADKSVSKKFEWGTNAVDDFPRGLDFSPDGTIAYVGTYSTGTPRIKKYVMGEIEDVAITFEVDMSVQIDKGNFDAGTGAMTLAGTMNDWDAAATPMLDGDADNVYSVTLDLTPGDVHNFKFVMNGSGWEADPNRTYTVPSSNDTFRAFFDNDDGAQETTEIDVSFQVNMELEIASQRFNPATDTLSARGSFNGWSGTETLLEPSTEDPSIYEGAAKYESFAGDVVFYKYAYTTANGVNWETNPPTESDNYEHTVTEADITNGYTLIPLRGYNNSSLATVVNQESVVRFVVDMNGAVDASGVAFPSIDTVAMAGANTPLGWPAGGWPDDDPNVIYLRDDGLNGDATANDDFWTVEITFPKYTPLEIQYKYGANWGLPSNNGINDNENGVGDDHFLTLFPSFWFGEAVDVFGTMGLKDVVNGVEQQGSDIPSSYSLGQNYPNPFNPSTVIDFSIPESGLVTMKIFNILGQEVAELVNEVRSAGFHTVSFDASNLTSGMYIYKIQSGNFSATKKMMLVK